jgi:hypothetical protein
MLWFRMIDWDLCVQETHKGTTSGKAETSHVCLHHCCMVMPEPARHVMAPLGNDPFVVGGHLRLRDMGEVEALELSEDVRNRREGARTDRNVARERVFLGE